MTNTQKEKRSWISKGLVSCICATIPLLSISDTNQITKANYLTNQNQITQRKNNQEEVQTIATYRLFDSIISEGEKMYGVQNSERIYIGEKKEVAFIQDLHAKSLPLIMFEEKYSTSDTNKVTKIAHFKK